MATKRWYLANALVDGWQELTEATQVAATLAVGWVVGTGLTLHSELQSGAERASTTFTGTTVPDGTLDTTLKDAFRTPAISGTFAAANWSFQFSVVSTVQAGAADGQIVFRMIKANADGSGATEITSAQQTASAMVNVSSANVNGTLTFNPGVITLTNQCLFIQIAWKRTGAGGMTTTNIRLRTGVNTTTGTNILSSDFVPTILLPIIRKDYVLRDDFNRADEYPLSFGGKWAKANLATYDMATLSNELYTSYGGGTGCASYWTIPEPADFNVSLQFVNITSSDLEMYLMLLANPTSATPDGIGLGVYSYIGRAYFTVTLYEIMAGNRVSGTFNRTIDFGPVVAGACFAVQRVGTTFRFWYRPFVGGPWTQLTTDVTASLHTGPLYPTFWQNGNTTGRWDNFGSGPDYSDAMFAPTVGLANQTVQGSFIVSTATLPGEALWVENAVVQYGYFGAGSPGLAAAQSISGLTGSLSSVSLDLQQVGTCVDNVFVTLNSTLNGTVLATSATVPAGSLPVGSFAWFNFTFPAAIALTGGTYFLQVMLSRLSSSGSNYIRVGSTGAVYSGGQAYDNTGTPASDDLRFRLYTGTPSHTVANVSGPQGVTTTHIASTTRFPFVETLWVANEGTPPDYLDIGTISLPRAGVCCSQTITGLTGRLTSVSLDLLKIGSPTDAVYLEIRESTHTGLLLATSSLLSCASVSSAGWAAYTFSFANSNVVLLAGTTYWIHVCLTRTVIDSSNRLLAHITAEDTYVNGELKDYLGTALDPAYDLLFRLYHGNSGVLKVLLASDITNGMAGCWEFNESNASDPAIDAHNDFDLFAGNAPAPTTGKIGGARTLTFSTKYFGRADTPELSLGADTSMGITQWWYVRSMGGAGFIPITKSQNFGSYFQEYALQYDESNLFLRFRVKNTQVVAAPFNWLPLHNTWVLIAAWYDKVAQKAFVRINNGTPTEAAWTGGTAYYAGSELRIGAMPGSGVYVDADVDQTILWIDGCPTLDQLDYIWNAGAGRPYTDFALPVVPTISAPTIASTVQLIAPTVTGGGTPAAQAITTSFIGTFAETLIDNFNRANESPLSGSGWVTPSAFGSALELRSQQLANYVANPEQGSCYWTTTAQNFSMSIQIPTFGPAGSVWIGEIIEPTASPSTGFLIYFYESGGDYYLSMGRFDAGTFTYLVDPSIAPGLVAGASIGFTRNGTKIRVWIKNLSGVWSLWSEVTDTAYQVPLYTLMLMQNSGAWRLDNFSTGPAIVAGTSTVFPPTVIPLSGEDFNVAGNQPWTIIARVKFESAGTPEWDAAIAMKLKMAGFSGGEDYYWGCSWGANFGFMAYVRTVVDKYYAMTFPAYRPPTLGVTYVVAAGFDPVAGKVWIRVNNDARIESAVPETTIDDGDNFNIGAAISPAGTTMRFDGGIGPVTYWKRAMTDDEIDYWIESQGDYDAISGEEPTTMLF